MIKYVLFFVAFRFLVASVNTTYHEGSSRCNELLTFARSSGIESARNIYCLEAVREDQRLTLQTLRKYKLGFLFNNVTYAYTSEVLDSACKAPWYVTEVLEWTAGVTTLSLLWTIVQIATWLWSKRPKPKIKPVTPPASPSRPPMVRPPKAPKKNTSQGIRQRKDEKTLINNLSKLANLSPKLRNRIMGEDV